MNVESQIKEYSNDAFGGLIGVASIDVTPPVGIYARNWGAAVQDVSEGTHRPLMMTCITLQTSETEKPFVLMSADFCVWRSSRDGKKIRERLLEEFAIPAENLMFCLSHNHASPVLSRDDAFRPGGELISPYLDRLEAAALDVVHQALAAAVEATLTWNYGKCKLASNRDLYDQEEGRFLTGFDPGQRADDTLLVGRITANLDDKIIGTVVNYACHPTTLAWANRLISPDYVGAMRELVSRETNAPCLFLQGASGQLAPKEQYSGDTALADKHGRQLGYAVMATLEDMLPPRKKLIFDGFVPSGADLAIWTLTDASVSGVLKTDVPYVHYQLKPIPSLKEIEEKYDTTTDRVLKERLWRQRGIRVNLGDGDQTSIPLWIWQVGDALLIGQSNEAYAEFQETLRKELPGAIAVINLVNGSAGYLPPRDLYAQNIYSVNQTPFAEGSLEELMTVALRAAKKITNQTKD